MKLEVRHTAQCEIRALSVGDVTKILGYAARFNSLSEDLGGFVEKIAPGAFREGLGKRDICAFWSHKPEIPLGRTSTSTLRLTEDDFGLRFEIDLPDNTWGKDAGVAIARGDVLGVSFGFNRADDDWNIDTDGRYVRTLLKVDIYEISPTAIPAYPETSVSARALESFQSYRERVDSIRVGVPVALKRAEFESRLKRRAFLERHPNAFR